MKAGALQGYLVDKKSAEKYNITSIADFKDPELAAKFDSDGNGKANLIGCNPGWGCELVIEHQLDAYGLRDTVEHVQGEYSALMADTVARYKRGEPILFYTWTPNWTIGTLVPGKDVVWIQTPFPSLPEDQKSLENQTTVKDVPGCVANPCEMGWPPNDIRVVANKAWLEKNPAAKQLLEQVKIPLVDISKENAKMLNGEDSQEAIMGHAQSWIADNRDKIDQWLAQAQQAAN